MIDKIIILDCGSQFTQVIGRRLRELNVYCEILPYDKMPASDSSVKGVIISGSPYSVKDKNAPEIDMSSIKGKYPILAICYGAQYIAQHFGGEVRNCNTREYGRARLTIGNRKCPLFKDMAPESQVWMSHGDSITALPSDSELIASTHDVEFAAYKIKGEDTYALQFHPEVFHTEEGGLILKNFVIEICKCRADWTPAAFIETTVKSLREQLGEDHVILGLSGGVDSSVTAVLMHKAIGQRLHCIFVDNGLLRKNEFEKVLASYKDMGLNVTGVNASSDFYKALAGISDPEGKRKAIGHTFVETFDREARKIKNAKWLAQGTIYPDVIESAVAKGPSATIKSHHNVGGLPKDMNLKIVEPLRNLFKDEVRRVGLALGIKKELISRHPFPGPGLGIRVLGEVTEEKLDILKNADEIYINTLRKYMTDLPYASNGLAPLNIPGRKSEADGNKGLIPLYDAIWQAGTILLPIKSVGVMGDERTYEYTIALRAVTSNDGMTADWVHLPYDFLARVSDEIINKVRGVNRVVYDISSKPPATIEWE
ncbi:MAG: glutamine-hydrolyzing GMP synthase [Bacteroidales bacterium]|jgi:GMP synthase (glutamine-hydrolysing)|nr:glutamine-hydrolyzing GMP synthase [Bacteroidales bacterium]